MIPASETFGGTWPFAPHFTERAGFQQHYVDEGRENSGSTIVLLHGEPTWGYLYRHLIGPLSRDHRVIVPDHMGFGKSATPADHSYLAGDHIDNLTSLLIDELDLTDITLVLHDWGGPIGTGFALRHPDRIKAVVAMNTVVGLGLPEQDKAFVSNMSDSLWFQWANAAAHDGRLDEVLGNAGSTVIHLMLSLMTITHPEIVTPNWVRAYSAHFTDRAACEGVIQFPRQLAVTEASDEQPAFDPAAVARIQALPAMLLYGMQDTALVPEHIIPAFTAAFPDAPVIEVANAGHFPQEDNPDAVLAALQLFIHSLR
ncbi:alpha/beta fold hydrolase [Streptomyces sp. NPDC090080]|uniref:alpha/beta fold hydrolase n=1 Tax=Streptomyces sp. NPDC090080 TaxID=3365939 RepID=UPI003816AF54